MTRASVFAGTITSADGGPAAGVAVFAIDARNPAATIGVPAPSSPPLSMTTTDADGVYRIGNLPPGEYSIVALVTSEGMPNVIGPSSEAEVDAALSRLRNPSAARAATPGATSADRPAEPALRHRILAPVFFPGTARREDAGVIGLSAASERRGLDFSMAPVPVAAVEGVISGADVNPDSIELEVLTASDVGGFALGAGRPILARSPDDNGRFRFDNMAPGRYRIVARGLRGSGSRPAAPERNGAPAPETSRVRGVVFGQGDVDVTGDDVTTVTITLMDAPRITGRIVLDSAAGGRIDLTQVRVRIMTAITAVPGGGAAVFSGGFQNFRPVPVASDGTFTFNDVAPGAIIVQCWLPDALATRWWPRSVIVGDQDLLDTPIVIAPGGPNLTAVVTISDQHAAVTGRLRTPQGLDPSNYDVIVFPKDSALWQPQARRVRTLPAGDGRHLHIRESPRRRLLIAVLTDGEPADRPREDFLGEAARSAIAVRVIDGAVTRQDLGIRGGGAPRPVAAVKAAISERPPHALSRF